MNTDKITVVNPVGKRFSASWLSPRFEPGERADELSPPQLAIPPCHPERREESRVPGDLCV